MTKKALTILKRHEAIKVAKLETITEAYKKPSALKKQIVKDLEKEINNRYAKYDICKFGIFSHNSNFFTYAVYVVGENYYNTLLPLTLYITPKKAVEVKEYSTHWIITEYENYNNKLYYKRIEIIDKPY